MTPSGAEINKVGLTPDTACRPGQQLQERFVPGRAATDAAAALRQDPCVRLALKQLEAAAASADAEQGGGSL
jgi:hypothetical protein